MTNKFRGVMQSPVTPLKDDFSLDLPTFEKVLDFHVRTGATAISWPHHKGESLNLTIAERKRFAEAAVKTVAGRIPVTIHVSALAVEDTFTLARHAQDIGADGILRSRRISGPRRRKPSTIISCGCAGRSSCRSCPTIRRAIWRASRSPAS
jgi:dihydrodipicolinate synthase/N-acetylneuraminate lyase